MSGRRTLLALLLLLLGSGCRAAPETGPPIAHHSIEYVVERDAAVWRVETTFTRLAGGEEVPRLRLEDWGEWTESGRPYISNLESQPPVRPDPSRPTDFIVAVPSDWGGTLRVRYDLPTVLQGGEHTLLPYRSSTYSLGFRQNTLLHLVEGDDPVFAAETVSLVPPPGWRALGGIGELSPDDSVPLPARNTAFVFGEPSDQALYAEAGRPIRCWQFGDDDPVCERTALVAARLVASFEASGQGIGEALPDTVTILVPGGRRGGTGIGGGVIMGYNPNLDDDPPEPGITTLLAHELLHHFVPYIEISDNTAVWFHEGFTDYLALWFVVNAGLMDPNTFAQRIEDKATRLRANPAYGQVSFADSTVSWREGANERIAYDGGALLAFTIDVEAQLDGSGSLIELVRRVRDQVASDAAAGGAAAGGAASYTAFEGWLSEAGLEDLKRRFVQGSEAPDVAALLERIGYTMGRRDALLVYPGIETDRGTEPGRVLSIDPEGPAAKTDLRVGDEIVDYAPRAEAEVHLPETVRTTYRFGLTGLARGGLCTLRVRRAGSELEIRLNPWLRGGGWQLGLVADGDAVGWFFEARDQP